jgi:hypothetical protein
MFWLSLPGSHTFQILGFYLVSVNIQVIRYNVQDLI